ncbi:protein of unknown function [Ruminococcaceae bacterium BL-6]|nr:protein of unknown function [Ruminococcaceae bacterium BL-6]
MLYLTNIGLQICQKDRIDSFGIVFEKNCGRIRRDTSGETNFKGFSSLILGRLSGSV